MPASDDRLAAVEAVLDGATLLGAELDVRYRVLGLTVDPAPGRHPDEADGGGTAGEGDDRRLQVLAHPTSTFLASLRLVEGDRRVVEAFTVDQLADVVHALDGPTIAGPVLGGPHPAPGEWGPEPSLQGRSSAPDGTFHRLRVEVTSGARELGLFVTFDEVDLRRPDGGDVELPGGGGDGVIRLLGG